MLLSAFLNYVVRQGHEGASLFIQSSCICYLYVCVVCTYYVGKSSVKALLKFVLL